MDDVRPGCIPLPTNTIHIKENHNYVLLSTAARTADAQHFGLNDGRCLWTSKRQGHEHQVEYQQRKQTGVLSYTYTQ